MMIESGGSCQRRRPRRVLRPLPIRPDHLEGQLEPMAIVEHLGRRGADQGDGARPAAGVRPLVVGPLLHLGLPGRLGACKARRGVPKAPRSAARPSSTPASPSTRRRAGSVPQVDGASSSVRLRAVMLESARIHMMTSRRETARASTGNGRAPWDANSGSLRRRMAEVGSEAPGRQFFLCSADARWAEAQPLVMRASGHASCAALPRSSSRRRRSSCPAEVRRLTPDWARL